MRVGAICRPVTVIVGDREPLVDVATRMRVGNVGAALVLRGQWTAGIITERDLTRAVADGVDLGRAIVADYMTPEPVVVTTDTEVRDAAKIMSDMGIRHLPVVDDGKFVGLISTRDIAIELVWAPSVWVEPPLGRSTSVPEFVKKVGLPAPQGLMAGTYGRRVEHR